MLGFPKHNMNDFATLNNSFVFSLQSEHLLSNSYIFSLLFFPFSHACTIVMSSAYANTCMLLGVSLSSSFSKSLTYTLNSLVPMDDPRLARRYVLFF